MEGRVNPREERKKFMVVIFVYRKQRGM